MKEILEKYISRDCTQSELDEAVSILNGKKGKVALDKFMQEHWEKMPLDYEKNNEGKFDLVLNQIHHKINIREKRLPLFRKIYKNFSEVAAILLIPLVLSFLLYYNSASSKDEVETFTSMSVPAGVQSQIDLPDGSKVWLNFASTIKYPTSFQGKDSRHIELQGEAYFEITPDKKHPFMVNVGDISVEVLGTSFNVSAYKDDPKVSVALIEGSVQLMSLDHGDKENLSVMKPMQVAHYLKDSKKLLLKTETILDQYVAWKERKLVYANEPFESVFRRMSRRYDVDYIIVDNELLTYNITGTFIHESLNEFLKIIAMTTPIEYSIIPGEKQADGSYTKRKIQVKNRKEL